MTGKIFIRIEYWSGGYRAVEIDGNGMAIRMSDPQRKQRDARMIADSWKLSAFTGNESDEIPAMEANNG